MVGGARAAVLGGTVLCQFSSSRPFVRGSFVPVGLSEAANTDGLAHVDVTSDSGGADVEPVDVLRRQLPGV